MDRETQSGPGDQKLTFVDNTDLTFVHYGEGEKIDFSYQPSARVHNARRRVSKRQKEQQHITTSQQEGADDTVSESSAINASLLPSSSSSVPAPAAAAMALVPNQPSLISIRETASLLSPISTFARDPFGSSHAVPREALERSWRLIFTRHFGLPLLESAPDLPNPAADFLAAARISDSAYRSIVVQPVVTSAASQGEQAAEAVFSNQALILRDFRRLAEVDTVPVSQLSRKQFQHVYAFTLSLSGHGFSTESGFNAVINTNSQLLSLPQNRDVSQTNVTEWTRMLIPRPGPSFQPSLDYQKVVFRKVNSVLNFLEDFQESLDLPYSSGVAHYLQPGSPIHKMIAAPVPVLERELPYPGFLNLCHHRALELLHKLFSQTSDTPSAERVGALSALEKQATQCLKFESADAVTLFCWCLVSMSKGDAFHHEKDEPLFPWGIKELSILHSFSFVGEMSVWLCYKSGILGISRDEVPLIDVRAIRARLRSYYAELKEIEE